MSVPHISDILARNKEEEEFFYSFEFLPPRTKEAEEKLWNVTVPRFVAKQPVFWDVTWGAGGSTSDTTLRVSKELQEKHGIPVNMHLTCTNMPSGLLKETLDACYRNSIRNIVALRGDPPNGGKWEAEPGGFTCALDLVKFIRSTYGDYFCICVAGYPEGHPSRIDPAVGKITEEEMLKELDYLKAKVDAGASFIITQLFYSADLFIEFVRKCREHGITVPILPGILPISSYKSLKRMVNLCKTYVPPSVAERVEELQDNPAALKEYGISQAVEMMRCIHEAGIGAKHFHMYVVNAPDSSLGSVNENGHQIQ